MNIKNTIKNAVDNAVDNAKIFVKDHKKQITALAIDLALDAGIAYVYYNYGRLKQFSEDFVFYHEMANDNIRLASENEMLKSARNI